MDNNQMREGINGIADLYSKFKENYEIWFSDDRDPHDKEKKYSKPGVSKEVDDSLGKIKNGFLVPLAKECFLREENIDNKRYKFYVQPRSKKGRTEEELKDTEDLKDGRITEYIWAKLIGKGIVIGHYISFDPESEYSSGEDGKFPAFYLGLDIENSGTSTKQKKDFYDRVDKLKGKIEKEKTDASLSCLDFTDDSKPIIKIDLSNYAGDSKKGYQDLLQEFTNAIVKLKALYKYVIFDGDDQQKNIMWEKVKSIFKSMYIAEQKSILLSPTVLKINDLLFEDCKQMVLTGAPGTGKTYSAKDFVKWQIRTDYSGDEDEVFDSEWKKGDKGKYGSRWTMVQFHPSFDYSDFVEGIRPAKVQGDDKMSFVRMDGVFKKFCRNVIDYGDKNIKYYFIIDEINRADLSKVFGELMYCLEENYRGEENKIQTQYSNLDTYVMEDGVAIPLKERNDKDIAEDDFEEAEDDSEEAEDVSEEAEDVTEEEEDVTEEAEDVTEEAEDDSEEAEDDSEEAEDVFEDGFYIPDNVIIIGTMNDIDRSVDTFDFALRRRFRWVNVDVDTTLLTSTFRSMNSKAYTKKSDDEITAFVQKIMNMNDVFEEPEYSKIFRTPKDYYVGPAYFEGLFKGQSMETIWNNKVEPLLKEYIRGRNAGDFINDTKKSLLLDTEDNVNADGVKEVCQSLKDDELIRKANVFIQENKDKFEIKRSDIFCGKRKPTNFSNKYKKGDLESLINYIFENDIVPDNKQEAFRESIKKYIEENNDINRTGIDGEEL